MGEREHQNTGRTREEPASTRWNQSSPDSSLEPVASNFYDSQSHTNLEKVNNPQIEPVPNVYASTLATSIEVQKKFGNFFNVFTDFHDASVQITVKHEDGGTAKPTKGSGVVFQPDESRLVILTAAHIFEDLTQDSEISIHLETSNTRDGKSKTHEITLEPSDYEITGNYQKDVAVIALGENKKREVREHVKNFPSASLLDEPFPSASLLDESNVLFMMIHYANENHKQVTTACREQTNLATLQVNLHMDGGPGASGAPIYSLSGNVVAIHKCRMQNNQEIKSCVLIKDVIDAERDENGHSDIQKVLREKDQSRYEYHPDVTQESASYNPFEIKEGNKSQKLLGNKIEGVIGELPREHLTKEGLLKISNNVTETYIRDNFRLELQDTLFESLGKGGKHKETKEHSFKDEIDSDHFPPWNAFKIAIKNCKDRELKRALNVTRDNLPAITIPKKIHEELDTTKRQQFRTDQGNLMSEGNFFDAIKMNFESYNHHGLFARANYFPDFNDGQFDQLLLRYREGFGDSLQEHANLGFITEEQKNQLLDTLNLP